MRRLGWVVLGGLGGGGAGGGCGAGVCMDAFALRAECVGSDWQLATREWARAWKEGGDCVLSVGEVGSIVFLTPLCTE